LVEDLGAPESNLKWLLERTEKFAKDKAVFNAITTSIGIMDGRNTKFNKEAIPSILQEALSVSFDKTVGHDYFGDAEKRFEFYHLKEDRIPFDLTMFNKITKGGLPRKTLNVILAPTGVGKSLFMCHHAAASIRQGLNALYISLEMAEERISERIDCNLMNVTLDELVRMKKSDFSSRMEDIQRKNHGRLIVKEYPTSTAHVGHFRALLDELKMKKNFIPDIIYIDYINICASQRYKAGANYNSYFAIKAIAEELRGMAVEYDVPILSATQTNKDGANNTEVEMTNTSECIFVDEQITLRDGTSKIIGDINVGDQIISNDGFKTVMQVHHKKMKECVKITLKSGKTIIVSKDHVFPSNEGRKSVNDGLTVGTKLSSK
jgi:archaellum biogenesis ATPase FlaH